VRCKKTRFTGWGEEEMTPKLLPSWVTMTPAISNAGKTNVHRHNKLMGYLLACEVIKCGTLHTPVHGREQKVGTL